MRKITKFSLGRPGIKWQLAEIVTVLSIAYFEPYLNTIDGNQQPTNSIANLTSSRGMKKQEFLVYFVQV
jgi:hypothetical protein